MGVVGAAYATLAAYLCAAGLSWQLGKREFVMPIMSRDVFRVIAAASATAVVAMVLFARHDQSGFFNWALIAVILSCVYGGLIVALNVGGLRSWLAIRARAFLERGVR